MELFHFFSVFFPSTAQSPENNRNRRETMKGTFLLFLLCCTDLLGELKLLVGNKAEKVQNTRGRDEKWGGLPYCSQREGRGKTSKRGEWGQKEDRKWVKEQRKREDGVVRWENIKLQLWDLFIYFFYKSPSWGWPDSPSPVALDTARNKHPTPCCHGWGVLLRPVLLTWCPTRGPPLACPLVCPSQRADGMCRPDLVHFVRWTRIASSLQKTLWTLINCALLHVHKAYQINLWGEDKVELLCVKCDGGGGGGGYLAATLSRGVNLSLLGTGPLHRRGLFKLHLKVSEARP